MSAPGATGLRTVEVQDERSRLARRAISLIQEAIWDVHPTGFLLAELEETRRGSATAGEYHLLAMVPPDDPDRPVAAAAGTYLKAVNAGFVSYLAVDEAHRAQGLGRALRAELVNAFRDQAQRHGREGPGNVLGEVERDSAWLRLLVAQGRVTALEVPYFHPWQSRRAEGHYILYREPITDHRPELPAPEVARLIDAIWRRAYRVRDPESRDTYRYMMRWLAERAWVGAAADVSGEPPGEGAPG